MIAEIKKQFNNGINRGFTVFQWLLIISMSLFAFQGNKLGVGISLTGWIIGFFEPNKSCQQKQEQKK